MSTKSDQHTVGVPAKRRGQQMGDDRSAIRQRVMVDDTPEISGSMRESANEMFADDSSQHFGGDAATPDHVSPSTPGAIPIGQPLGQTGGEATFKQNQQK